MTVNMVSGEVIKNKLNLSDDIINDSASILAFYLLDYARSGGDMENLSSHAKEIFAKN